MKRSSRPLFRGMQCIEINRRAPASAASNSLIQNDARELSSQTGNAAKIAEPSECPDVTFLYNVFRFVVI
jgi:hypothetical protein